MTRRVSGSPKKLTQEEIRREGFRSLVVSILEESGLQAEELREKRNVVRTAGLSAIEMVKRAKMLLQDDFKDNFQEIGILLLEAENGLKLPEVTVLFSFALGQAESFYEKRFTDRNRDEDFKKHIVFIGLRDRFDDHFFPDIVEMRRKES